MRDRFCSLYISVIPESNCINKLEIVAIVFAGMYRNTPQRQKRRSMTAPSNMHDLPEGPDICIKFVDLSANNVSDLTPLSRAPHRLLQEFRFLEKLDLSDNGLTEFPKELTDVSDYSINLPFFSFYDLN